MVGSGTPDLAAITDEEFAAEVDTHEFYISIIMALTHAFDRVRKYMIENDLSLWEEMEEYLTPDQISFISRVVRFYDIEVEPEGVA